MQAVVTRKIAGSSPAPAATISWCNGNTSACRAVVTGSSPVGIAVMVWLVQTVEHLVVIQAAWVQVPYLNQFNNTGPKWLRSLWKDSWCVSAKNYPHWETKIGKKATGKWADITCWLSEDGYCSCFIVRCSRPVTTGNSVANQKMNYWYELGELTNSITE